MTQTYPQYPQHHRSSESTRHPFLWLISLSLMFWPRLILLGFAIFSHFVRHAMSTGVAILGFLLAPCTTLAYASMWSISTDGVHGWEWLVVAIGVLLDLTAWLGLKTAMNR